MIHVRKTPRMTNLLQTSPSRQMIILALVCQFSLVVPFSSSVGPYDGSKACAYAFTFRKWPKYQVKSSSLSGRCSYISHSNDIQSRTPLRSRSMRLHLFSVNLNNNKGSNDNDNNDDDFPTWVRALQQWPLTSPTPSSKRISLKDKENTNLGAILPDESTTKKRFPSIGTTTNVPLASLLNIEALLMASEGEKQVESVQLTDVKSGDDNTRLQKLGTTALQKLGDWDKLMSNLQRSISDLTDGVTVSSGAVIGTAADSILKEATSRLDYFVASTSTAISPAALQELIFKASQALTLRDGGIETAANSFVAAAEKLAREQGLDVREAAERARETTKYTADLVTLANGLLVAGYAKGDKGSTKAVGASSNLDPQPLFHEFESAKMLPLSDYSCGVAKVAEMGSLSGAIYQATIDNTRQLGHAIVQNGTAADVTWMITDSIGFQEDFVVHTTRGRDPIFVRTLTIRGFDASDESVDREQVLNEVCTANPVRMGKSGLMVHAGMQRLAKAVYADIKDCLDLTAPDHKIVINGHSIGGSISVLILLLMVDDRGADYVRNKIARVYTFGSPPVVMLSNEPTAMKDNDYLKSIQLPPSDIKFEQNGRDILAAVGLPSSMVYGYVQPWDPIVRLFSAVDPLYPLVGDLGDDGLTPFASGPPRTLRPVTRAIIESWEGWPRFRDNFRATVSQDYVPVGLQHILVPEPVRYLSDRLVAVNVQVPDVEGVVRISSSELLPALQELFPLDVFRISLLPSGIRSFIHHFFPAYGFPIVDYSAKTKPSVVPQKVRDQERREYVEVMEEIKEKANEKIKESKAKEKDEVSTAKAGGWSPAQWLQFPRNEP